MVITLAFGTTWLKIVADLTWTAAFMGGVAPFVIVGLLKAVTSCMARCYCTSTFKISPFNLGNCLNELGFQFSQ